MKKLFTLLLFVLLCSPSFAQLGQIMNGGFENWSNINLYENPTTWRSSNTDEFRGVPLITKSTDAQHGSFSARLDVEVVGTDTLFPYLYLGNVGTGGGGPDAGIPYSSSCDKFNCYVKGSLAAGDTAFVVAIKFNSGTAIAFDVVPLMTGTLSTWTAKTVSISALPQDSLFIGVVLGNPFATQQHNPNSYFMVDNTSMGVTAGPTPAALPNFSFENWTSESIEEADNWFSLNPILSGLGIANTTKTTDAAAGSFAVQMETITINGNNDTLPGVISFSPIDIAASGSPFQPVPYSAEPATLSGQYKFAPNGTDEGFVLFEFYSGGTVIGGNYQPFNTAQTAYTSFSINTNLSGTPDSILFVAMSGDKPGTILKLDELSFSGGNVGVTELLNEKLFSIYPNPATTEVFLLPTQSMNGEATVTITDMTGRMIDTFIINSANQKSIDISGYNSGSYLIQLENNGNIMIEKLIVR